MFLIDLLDTVGLALTLLTLALLAVGGYLLALRLLGEETRRDLLAVAIASLLAMTAEALAIGLLLGSLGLLDFKLALLLQTLLVAGLAFTQRRSRAVVAAGDPQPDEATITRLLRHTWRRLRAHPAMALITTHALASEAIRGLLRPPLSFDSLMYHLLLTATWLQERNLKIFNGAYPISDYTYVPANGSLWLWWWMAPSHSELYVNLSAIPQWLLLGLVVGGIARQLGAKRHWPLASFLVLLTPTVVRFVATQYVDIFLAATFLAACFFTLQWLERPKASFAALAGLGCGLAAGAKILGVPYCGVLAAAALLLVPSSGPRRRVWQALGALTVLALAAFLGLREVVAGTYALILAVGIVACAPLVAGEWRRRLPHLALAVLLAAALGSFFYARNLVLGAGPLALSCEGRSSQGATQSPAIIQNLGKDPSSRATAKSPILPTLPRADSALDLWATVGHDRILDSFLGITRPQSVELGLGPQAFVLLLAFLALPFALAGSRRAALFVASQIGFELIFWLAVPYAANLAIFANIRYLIPAAGLAFAAAVAIAEERGMSELWLQGLALAIACQGLLQLHAEMPRGVRLALVFCDVAAVAFGMSAALRSLVLRRARLVVAVALLLALAGAPLLARFRQADRSRALSSEWTAHHTSVGVFTTGWRWLDLHGGSGMVANVTSPGMYFTYPAMGMYLERKVRYININTDNYDEPHRYAFCNPRVDPSYPAWLEHLKVSDVRWLLVSRYPAFDWPPEREWALAHPELFEPRFADDANLIFEFLPPPLIPWRHDR